jgi:hypothetical protein
MKDRWVGSAASPPSAFLMDQREDKAHCCSTRRRRNWALVHMHVSVGVPDEEVVDLQRRWGAEAD